MITHLLQQKLHVSSDLKGLSEAKIQNTTVTKKNTFKTQYKTLTEVKITTEDLSILISL